MDNKSTLFSITGKLPSFLKSKYLLTLAFFIVWIFIFDKMNLILWLKELEKNRTMEIQKQYYEREIQTISQQLEELQTNSQQLEKFAREQYYLKKEGEDIFLVEE